MKLCALGMVAVLTACLGMSTLAHGAAATASGATTSAKPTAKDPVKRQMQIAADPFGVTDFQFTLEFDANILHIAADPSGPGGLAIRAINGYTLGLRNDPYTPAYMLDFVNNPTNGTNTGYVTVQGFWNQDHPAPQYDIDVFDVVFELNEGRTTAQFFEVRAMGITHDTQYFGNDFMMVDEFDDNGMFVRSRTFGPGQIATSTTNMISIDTANVPLLNAVPAPLAAQGGVLTMAALLLGRRRQAAA